MGNLKSIKTTKTPTKTTKESIKINNKNYYITLKDTPRNFTNTRKRITNKQQINFLLNISLQDTIKKIENQQNKIYKKTKY